MSKLKIKKIISMILMVLAISILGVTAFAATPITGYELFFPKIDGQVVTSQNGSTVSVSNSSLTAITYSASIATSRMSVTLYTSSGTSKGTEYIDINNASIEELKTTLVWSNLASGQYYLKYSIGSPMDEWYVDTILYDGVN